MTWPSKLVELSSCVIMVRPSLQRKNQKNDYEVLLLKRNQKLQFGGFYAFPGGKVDPEDQFEKYA